MKASAGAFALLAPQESINPFTSVWDRLNPTWRGGCASILRTILSAPELAAELLAFADRQGRASGSQ
ncbi:hypothetical protein [Streptomyces sp. NBC_00838]|uniref:hypothetical protein n=1 Tax=Streptomyces sp. NBC_00838 TaxID=2903680 RepID=UPI00386C1FBB